MSGVKSIVEQLSTRAAAWLSAGTGIPSAVYAVMNADWLPVVAGITTGTFFAVWSIHSAGRDKRLEAVQRRYDQSEAEVDRLMAEANTLASERQKLRLRVEELEIRMGIVEKSR